MVAEFLRLRLALLGNTLVGAPRRAGALIVGLLVAAAALVLLCLHIGSLSDAPVVDARSELVIGGSVALIAFAIVPLVAQRTDAMDPRRFSLFGIAPRPLATALAISSLATLPSLAVVLLAVASVVAWSRGALVVVLAVVGAAIGVATILLAARVSAALAASLLSSRRSQELVGVIGIVILLVLAPVIVFSAGLAGADAPGGESFAEGLAALLGATPLGAAWAIPASVAAGDAGGAFFSFVVAAITLAVLWFAWRALVSVLLTTPAGEHDEAAPAGLGWFARLPSTPTASIAARSLTYWSRDPRYFIPLLVVPIVPIIFAVPLVLVEFPLDVYALFPLPVMCLFLGFSIHNDVALDHSAIWLHIVSGKRGLADRLGRMAPVLLLGLPLIGVGSVVSVFLSGNDEALPSVLGVSTCLLFSGIGLGSLVSARFPYPATRPGDSPFVQPQLVGSTSAAVQVGSFVGTLVFTLPSLYYAVGAVLESTPEFGWSSLWWGVGVGVLMLIVGAAGGGAIFDRKGPEILAASLRS